MRLNGVVGSVPMVKGCAAVRDQDNGRRAAPQESASPAPSGDAPRLPGPPSDPRGNCDRPDGRPL